MSERLLRLIRREEVQRMVPMSEAALYAEMRAGRFPRPRKLSAQSVAWLEHEVQEWIAALPVADGKGDEPPRGRPAKAIGAQAPAAP